MTREYSALALAPLASPCRLAETPSAARLTPDHPALAVMTDLHEVAAATTTPEEPLDEAHEAMLRRDVRLLFVVDQAGLVQGVITATDLLGEKPMRFAQERGVSHAEVRVGDIMTPAERLEAISLGDLASMRVGHVVATMKAVHRQHLLVSEDGGRRIRGLFSAWQIARRLGVDLQTTEVAQTFADIEAALVR
jgi:CBS domain-containing protein